MDQLIDLRKRLGLTQSQLALRLGVTRATINRWENGHTRPSRLAVKALSGLAGGISSSKRRGGAPEGRASRPMQAKVYPAVLPQRSPGNKTSTGRPGFTQSPDQDAHARIDMFSQSPIFSGLDREHLVELAELATERDFKAGQFLFFENHPVDCCYAVASGMLKILKHSPSGRDFITAIYGPGQMLGNILLFLGKPHVSSGQALTDVKVLLIKRNDFLSFLRRHPESSFKILGQMLNAMSRRYEAASARLSELVTERTDCRLARVLLALTLEFGPAIHLTRREIAEMAGTTPETATRFISRLRHSGTLQSSRGAVTILQPGSLRLLAQVPLP